METNPVFSNNIANNINIIIFIIYIYIYNENSRGLRTDPCGTPYFTGDNWDLFLPI